MEASGLADLLRALKERSGLSYGVLAKRLHVSTSTLHRYCNGSTVPTEFAPVERLARLCKATPEELIQVHRQWIVADATRGRKGAAEGAVEGARPVDGAPVVDGPVVDGAAAGHDSADVASPDSAPTGAARQESIAPTEAKPEAKAEGKTEGPPEENADSPRPAPVSPPAGTAASPDGRPQRERRPRKFVLAAVAAACVMGMGSAALAVGLTGGGGDNDGRKRSAEASSSGKAVGPGKPGQPGYPGQPGPAPSGTPSTSPENGKKKESGKPSAPTGPDGAASPSPSGERGEENGSGSGNGNGNGNSNSNGKRDDKADADGTDAPLTAHTRPYAYETLCSQRFLVNRDPGEMPKPPIEQDAPAWVSELGAVSADDQFIKITLQGAGKDTVVLEDLHVRVDGTDAPLAWNAYSTGVGCGGDVATRSFGVDLDAGSPALTPVAGQRAFPYKVSRTDPEVFYVKAAARQHDVRWHLELQWSSGGRRGILRIDDQGRPFRTSGSADRPSYQQPPGDTRWSPTPRI
ncbi:transcriptional regulator [Streptomyces eurocidicus]|uniref:Plasmid maintenance system antidote protein VapI n=1 Tax=Streptomyces eurocidicus TaxID=66423 RepID=A0A7W8BDH8_STREU|nr:helix-turn-helix transcriptional regulator [Streptomyces eurocidicus]MBB5121380.1 plasmid maintenance system antidote protein VapI [Streptomyces eurocidicus]MBF6050984.1 helix-turn-helix domain-containing protein [Streptomyces eurocidicus]